MEVTVLTVKHDPDGSSTKAGEQNIHVLFAIKPGLESEEALGMSLTGNIKRKPNGKPDFRADRTELVNLLRAFCESPIYMAPISIAGKKRGEIYDAIETYIEEHGIADAA